MNHLIIGAGNLGIDLMRTLGGDANNFVSLVSESNGFDVRDNSARARILLSRHWDYVWYCVGFGSLREAEENPLRAWDIHCGIPLAISSNLGLGQKLVLFSTDYIADPDNMQNPDRTILEPRSKYEELKIRTESSLTLMNTPNRAIVRIGSLYGFHKPKNTFPGKIISSILSGRPLTLVRNEVTPTPTKWLAHVLVENLEKLHSSEGTIVHNCAPSGSVSIRDWVAYIVTNHWLKNKVSIELDTQFDHKRPLVSSIGNTLVAKELNPHWHALHQVYFSPAHYLPE